MNLSNQIKSRFIKDFSLNIQLFQDDYFFYFMNLYNNDFETFKKLDLLYKNIAYSGSEDIFLKDLYDLRDKIINYLKNSEAYQNFTNMDMSKFEVPKQNITKNDIFKKDNDRKTFISIDLIKANFQVMRSLSIIENETYLDFLKNFTDNPFLIDYFYQSKYERQVIFGNLCPGRQVTIQKFYTNEISEYLKSENKYTKDCLKVQTYDELVFESDFIPNNLKEDIYKNTGHEVKIQKFYLEHKENPIQYYVKHIDGGGIEFKAVPIVYFPQVYKSYYNLPTTDYDYRFLYEGKVAQFILK